MTLPPLKFQWTVFASRYAISSERGLPQTVAVETYESTFEEYVRQHRAFSEACVPKDQAPGIIHGLTNGFRGKNDIRSCSALVLDCDDGGDGDPESLLADPYLQASGYMYQARYPPLRSTSGIKWHLVVPFTSPMVGLEPAQVLARRAAALAHFSLKYGIHLDPSSAGYASILHPYSRRVETDPIPKTIYHPGTGLDLRELLGDVGYTEMASLGVKRTPPKPTEGQKVAEISAIHAALDKGGFFLDYPPKDAGRIIRCPCAEGHTSDQGTSTLVTPSGRIVCLHGSCRDRRQEEFLAKLPLEEANYSPIMRLQLDAEKAPDLVTVLEAHRAMHAALETTVPVEGTATVVRVTTGAGKTRAAAEFLDRYSTPVWDPETGDVIPGRAAVMAVPTNALLREVDTRITVDHRVRVGVLAVIGDDGAPACRKHAEAKALQAAGGDVHRQMCAHCEFRDVDGVKCPAIEGSSRGEGALTLTNHALLPSVVNELLGSGRIPLVVWDESPPLVTVSRISFKDVDWLVERFDAEGDPGSVLDALDSPALFGEAFREAYRPFVEVLRRVKIAGSLEEAVREYAATRVSRSQMGGEDATWQTVTAKARSADAYNPTERGFDALPQTARESVLRAETLKSTLATALRTGSRLRVDVTGLEITATTAAGELWRTRGGVILDATAPLDVLRGLRPDCRVIDLHVKDEGKTLRIMKPHGGVGRTQLHKTPPERRDAIWKGIANEIRKEMRRSEATRGLVITYQRYVEELRAQLPEFDFGYFGNVRGYDRWFQEGYDMFVTVGDPFANAGEDQAVHDFLEIPGSVYDFSTQLARSELAQSHGRARSPQVHKGGRMRTHCHFGKIPPMGWNAANCLLDRNKRGRGK